MRLSGSAIDRVGDQRMPDRSHVDADLMGAAGFEPAFDQRRVFEQIQPLLTLCIEDGLLIDVGAGLHYMPAALEKARAICQTTLAQEGGATMSQLREAWGVTRKYSVPLCEWFDGHSFTLREGDLRRAGPELAKPIGG